MLHMLVNFIFGNDPLNLKHSADSANQFACIKNSFLTFLGPFSP